MSNGTVKWFNDAKGRSELRCFLIEFVAATAATQIFSPLTLNFFAVYSVCRHFGGKQAQ